MQRAPFIAAIRLFLVYDHNQKQRREEYNKKPFRVIAILKAVHAIFCLGGINSHIQKINSMSVNCERMVTCKVVLLCSSRRKPCNQSHAGPCPRMTDRHEKNFQIFRGRGMAKIEKFFSKKARSAPFFESKSFCGFFLVFVLRNLPTNKQKAAWLVPDGSDHLILSTIGWWL